MSCSTLRGMHSLLLVIQCFDLYMILALGQVLKKKIKKKKRERERENIIQVLNFKIQLLLVIHLCARSEKGGKGLNGSAKKA